MIYSENEILQYVEENDVKFIKLTFCDVNGKINPAELDDLMPWSEELPDECRKSRR